MLPDFELPNKSYELIALAVPAVIFLYIRAQFLNGRMPKAGDAAVNYLALTAVYYAVMFPFIKWAQSIPGNDVTWWVGWIVLTLLLPSLLGLSAGIVASKAWVYKFLRKFGFSPVHLIPTAWEWKFADCQPTFIVITLCNGRAFGAWYGIQSFVSTDPTDKDVFLEETYDIDKHGCWSLRGFAMLINSNEISTVEFAIPNFLGDQNERQEERPSKEAA